MESFYKLPDDVLTTYLCNVDWIMMPRRKKRSFMHVIQKRQAPAPLQEMVDKFGSENIEKLQTTLMTFFNESINDHVDVIMSYKSRFYYAELKVLKNILETKGVAKADLTDVAKTVKEIRDRKDVREMLLAFMETWGILVYVTVNVSNQSFGQ